MSNASNLQAPPPAYPAPQTVPGKTLGIVSVILPFVGLGLVGLILGIVAKAQSKKVGAKNTPAVVGIVLGAISVVVGLIVTIVIIAGISAVAQQCQQLGPGVHQSGGVTITCGS
jgi:predicted cation transporter